MTVDSKTVMVVDDEESFVRAVCTVLKLAGYTTVATRNPDKVLTLISEHHPSLVLLDIRMPDVDGLTLLQRIREQGPTPVIMLTAVNSSESTVRALRLGADDYITKPVGPNELLDRVGRTLETHEEPAVGSRMMQYELRRLIGEGGMGEVYAAHDSTLDRPVAVKLLQPELARDPFYELLFLREARAAARLSHPGIVTIYEAGRHRGRLFMVMELVDGSTLYEILRSRRTVPRSEAVRMVLQTAEALDAAHDQGLVHLDIKPSNIMLTPEQRVKVLDFGLARLGRRFREIRGFADFAGTPLYASPEQLRNESVDPRSDVFSLGVVLHELVAGEHPFGASGKDDSMAILKRIDRGPRRPLSRRNPDDIPLCDIAERMMASDRDRRPGSMHEVIVALRRIEAGL